MKSIPAPERSNGFTLVELLVALFIFGLIASAGVALLRSSSDSQLLLKEKLSDRATANRVANLLESDLAQAVPRPIRTAASTGEAAFTDGSIKAGRLFAFTRVGLVSDRKDRSAIARVEYSFAQGILARRSHFADGDVSGEPAALLKDIQSIETRFRDSSGNWRTDWSAADPAMLPRALELTITPREQPPYRLVMLVGSQLRSAPVPESEDNEAL